MQIDTAVRYLRELADELEAGHLTFIAAEHHAETRQLGPDEAAQGVYAEFVHTGRRTLTLTTDGHQ